MAGKVFKITVILAVVCLVIVLASSLLTGETYRVDVTYNLEDAGTVEGEGSFTPGEQVTLKAFPAEGYTFAGWKAEGEMVSAEKEYSFNVEEDRVLTAAFQLRSYDLQVDHTGGGRVEISGEPRHGEEVVLQAVPEEDHLFLHWEENGEKLERDMEYRFTIQRDRSLNARFLPVEEALKEHLEVTINPSGAGDIEAEAHGSTGGKLLLTSRPEFGFQFNNWKQGGEVVSTGREYTVDLEEETELVANFEEGLERVDGDDLLAPVGKETYLGRYSPDDLKEIPDKLNARNHTQHLRSEALEHLVDMYQEAKEDGVTLQVASAYRSYENQQSIFQRYAEQHGEEEANRFSARPGQSEHQLGTTVDFGGTPADFSDEFAETPQGQWLKENAYRFGFVMSYPEDSKDITGYIYEPWHYRYIGVDKAVELQETEKVLIEFIEAERR